MSGKAAPIFQSDDPTAADVAELLARHHAQMRAQSPPESCHVKTSDELSAAAATTFSLRDPAGGDILAVGAMIALGGGDVELKSMHVRAEARGRGLGRVLLDHMVAFAKAQGARSLWLETGSNADYAAARGLYAAAGFSECAPFGDYKKDPLSTFMNRSL